MFYSFFPSTHNGNLTRSKQSVCKNITIWLQPVFQFFRLGRQITVWNIPSPGWEIHGANSSWDWKWYQVFLAYKCRWLAATDPSVDFRTRIRSQYLSGLYVLLNCSHLVNVFNRRDFVQPANGFRCIVNENLGDSNISKWIPSRITGSWETCEYTYYDLPSYKTCVKTKYWWS